MIILIEHLLLERLGESLLYSWANGVIDQTQGYRPEELMLRAKQLVDRLEY